jgi:hypothetical protein
MNSKPIKLIFSSLLFFIFINSLAFSQSSPNSVTFTKKEIAFFKWGDGPNEVGITKHEEEDIVQGTDAGDKIVTYEWPRGLDIDGNDNLYFGNGNGQIFIISSEDGSVKTISWKKTGGLWMVDGDGNIYARSFNKGKQPGFILTRPDGSQRIYQNFDFCYVENGVAYNLKKDESITITDKGDKPEKLPPSLLDVSVGKNDSDKKYQDTSLTFIIGVEKINKHLKKINRQLNVNKIQVSIEKKKGLGLLSDLFGVDDDGNSYFLCSYLAGKLAKSNQESSAYIMVFSQTGKKLAEIPIQPDYFDQQNSTNEFKLDIHGNIFQMLALADGMRIIKWQKN